MLLSSTRYIIAALTRASRHAVLEIKKLHYCTLYCAVWYWASLVAQLVKNPPAMRETWVRFLGWEDPLEKGKATHSSILAWRIPLTV